MLGHETNPMIEGDGLDGSISTKTAFPPDPGPGKENVSDAAELYQEGLRQNGSGNWPAALAVFEKVVGLSPEDWTAWNNLGVLHHRLNRLDLSEKAFRRTVGGCPRNGNAWYGLGKVLETTGQGVEAIDAYQRCLFWDPAHARGRVALDRLVHSSSPGAVRSLRIGLVSIWFERGQAYVTRQIRDALDQVHPTHVFARTGEVNHRPMIETGGFWNVPRLVPYPSYRIPPDVLVRWIRDNRLDAVIFNEEYDWDLVKAAKDTGIKVLTYLDFYRDDWKPWMDLYDAVLCSTRRSYEMVKGFCRAVFIGWAVDIDRFRPLKDPEAGMTFFHNAGWLGINYRKMTPALIEAFDILSRRFPKWTLLVHAQAGPEMLPPDTLQRIRSNPRIAYHVQTVPAPGLYHRGRILVFPSKLEGLGLPLLEGLSCGLPAIATDAPPMNEFVFQDENGFLVRVGRTADRKDGIAFPESLVDMSDLILRMEWLGRDHEMAQRMGKKARCFAEAMLCPKAFSAKLNVVLADVFS